MKSQDTKKSSEILQKEVHGQIDKIGKDIDYARTRLSPGAILDDAIFYPHGQSLSSTYTHLKNNPMGSMFLSLGTLLLMEDQKHVTYEQRLKGQVSGVVDKGRVQFQKGKDELSTKAHEAVDKAKIKGEELKHRAQEKAHEAKSNLQNKGEQFRSDSSYGSSKTSSKAQELKHKGTQKIQHAREVGSEKAHNLKQRASEKLHNAKESIHGRDFVDSLHPFAIASVGLGLGATLGASFPVSAAEKNLRDDKFEKKIERISNDVDHAIKESGNRIKNHLIDELKQFNFH